MHPEIAPNEYNKWLTKHGVDTNETGSLLIARKPSVTRRRSVLSEQYNPEDDEDEDDEEDKDHPQGFLTVTTTSRRKQQDPIPTMSKSLGSGEADFLSGVFSVPLDQMGEPPLKTKASLRRAISHSATPPELSKNHMLIYVFVVLELFLACDLYLTLPLSVYGTGLQDDKDISSQDLASAKRAGGLRKGGMSLLRRSARTKIRRDSTTSMEIHNDASRLRQTVDENGDYPAVTLVDPGPLPLPSQLPMDSIQVDEKKSPIQLSQDSHNGTVDDSTRSVVPAVPAAPQPLKRFVSTLRDSSKPTITTYVDPQLLEQQRREMDRTPSSPSTTPLPYGSDIRRGVPTAGDQIPVQDRLKSGVTSTVTYPIPPPKKLTHNLLQPPSTTTSLTVGSIQANSSTTQMSNQQVARSKMGPFDNNVPVTLSPSTSKKTSSTWSWFKGKDKNDLSSSSPRTSHQGPNGIPPPFPLPPQADNHPVAAKKQSTLSLLFSRNGKTVNSSSSSSSKVQTSLTTSSMGPGGRLQNGRAEHDMDYENDPSRMPIQIERAIYRMSHVKLANPRRPLHEQVLISNMMFWYLGVVQQQQQLEQQYQQYQQQQQPQQQQQLLQQSLQQAQYNQDVQEKESQQGRGREVSSRVNGGVHNGPLKQEKSRYDNINNNNNHLNGASEPRIAGSDQVVPQQDSNSHARSPSKNSIENHHHGHSLPSTSASREDSEYDEESSMGGGYMEEVEWQTTYTTTTIGENIEKESNNFRKDPTVTASSLLLGTGSQLASSHNTLSLASRSQESLSVS